MKSLRSVLLAAALLLAPTVAVADSSVAVVVSIKPIHSLVAAVMDGIGQPYLIMRTASSPHSYSMKPSDARALERAGVVFWVGEELETFLHKSLETLARNARIVTLSDADGLIKLERREGGPFENHDHGDVEHEDDEHSDSEADMHLWLDPMNAKAMVAAVVRALTDADPDNAGRYRANAEALNGQLDSLASEVRSELAPFADRPFIVFHDAYQYFEQRFGVRAAGSVTANPEVIPGAGRIAEIHMRIEQLGSACVFAEPQFNPRLVRVLTSGTGARAGVLDPLGAGLSDGPALYFKLIRDMARIIATCLSQSR